MNRYPEINDRWIKASIIGTIWAASEIVLGSFFHNLRIPFSSNILTAIAIIILISANYNWSETGLFWRAGLICALMKTMSPSAVIFGPMIAIFSQAFLLEIFTRLLGKNIIGYAVGAMFAMTWNLFHKIMNFIIFYGFNIVNIYADLLKYTQKQLRLDVDLVWSPILVLALIYCTIGLIAAIIGIRVGKKLIIQPAENKINTSRANDLFSTKREEHFDYSIAWLFIDIGLVIIAFAILNFGSWIWWSTGITAIVLIWVIRYKRALRQLARPLFWTWFVIITMVTAFVITRIQSNELIEGLITGIRMNFRAAVVILGFAVLGTELYNPRIREFFLRTSFRQLPLALELSFKSLPMTIASIPTFREIVKDPVSVIHRVMSHIEYRLREIQNKRPGKVFIVTGAVGQGKTTQIRKIIENLKMHHLPVSGICSPRIMKDGLTIGYDIVDIETGTSNPFLRKTTGGERGMIGNYNIIPEGLEKGLTILERSSQNNSGVVVIDEVGQLELDDLGWSEKIPCLLNSTPVLLFAIRDTFTSEIVQKWDIKNYGTYRVTNDLNIDLTNMIIEELKKCPRGAP